MHPLIPIHVAAGAVLLVAGTAALSARKGSHSHARTGTWFLASMPVMAGTGTAHFILLRRELFRRSAHRPPSLADVRGLADRGLLLLPRTAGQYAPFMRGSPPLYLPPLAVLAAMIFWILRVRYSKAFGSVRPHRPAAEQAKAARLAPESA